MERSEQRNELSIEDLVGQLGDTTEYNDLKEKVSQIAKSKTKVSAALPRAQRERLERKVAYEDSKSDISLWNGIVFKNREKTFLTFDDANPSMPRVTSNSLAAKFEPTTEMEKEIDVILEKSDMKEKGIRDKESRDLAVNKLSVDEVRARNQELAKMKSLMFYQEQKNKRINKIKSKKFHKIHKKAEERRKEKERELLKETDPALYRELLEKDAMKRAQERISLKHKNTSKWVKRALRYGMQDANTRDAINEQLREGEKLRRRMEGQGDDSSSEEDVDDTKLLDEAEAVLKDLNAEVSQPATGVFQMAFMKRALEKQREEARLDAERLMQALQEEEEFDDDKKEESLQEESAQAAKIREVLSSGSVRRDKQKTKSLSVADTIKVGPLFEAPQVPALFDDEGDVGGEAGNEAGSEAGNGIGGAHGSDIEAEDIEVGTDPLTKNAESEPVSHLLEDLENEDLEGEDEKLLKDHQDKETLSQQENPWLLGTGDEVSRSNTRKEITKGDDAVDIAGTMARLEVRAAKKRDEKRSEKREAPKVVIIDSKSKKEPVKGVLGMEDWTQEELMTRAFGDEEAEKEFAEQKAEAEAEEIETYKREHGIKETPMLEGWGSWAGIGAPEPKRRFVPKEPKIELPERSDAHLKHVIINQNEDKKSEMYRIQGVPYPFTSREQYERAMRQPLGREWNANQSFHNLTRPEVKTRLGTIIDPIKKQKQKARRKF
ncbi:hypothetical protein JH06_3687 [Blastocystis sp. subtype 4]|uniref:hypothetical protein n=1 Tax=Blastocystis sp. subtype 4 TaxID=944170 RepID=UPI0007115F7E|nr:hypothetical protein JH06_3687 [Blastocystis sp. subtype 4]KNB44600.1 hypothetical protein JH06_3687 [Blastocystis sp. subtype 4]|eukprot:XP_014528043.1 hypothetical protein JH06_3687 [Blastocystis sp. subtype 4]